MTRKTLKTYDVTYIATRVVSKAAEIGEGGLGSLATVTRGTHHRALDTEHLRRAPNLPTIRLRSSHSHSHLHLR
jgi:hypothetical protein